MSITILNHKLQTNFFLPHYSTEEEEEDEKKKEIDCLASSDIILQI